MKRVGTQELFSYAVFFLCLSVVLFARAEEWWEAPDWRPTPNDEEAFVQDYPDEHQFLAACRQGRVDVMEYWLSQKGFRPNDEFIRGCKGDRVSGLWVASQKGHTAGVKLLIKAGADLNQARNDGVTPLFIASQEGLVEVVEILVKATGADLNQASDGATPLFQASSIGHVEVVEILIQAGADLNQGPDDGATPLFMASQNGHAKAVEILVKAGADPTRKWHYGFFLTQSPLTTARNARPLLKRMNPEKHARYGQIIEILKSAVKVRKNQKIAPSTGTTVYFDPAVDMAEMKNTVTPLMGRLSLKDKAQ